MSTKETSNPDPSKEISCNGCQEKFVSKAALFRHLRASEGKCFSPEEYKDFVKFMNSESNREKIMILYGYIPGDYYLSLGLKNEKVTIHSDSPKQGVCDGQHATQLILEAIEIVSYEGDIDEEVKSSKINARPNRSYGHFSHSSDICAQDELTGAVTEILTTKAPPLLVEDCSKAEKQAKEEEATKTWIDKVNSVLGQITSDLAIDAKVEFPGIVKVFGRLQSPKRFNAEMDVNNRRVDYLLPADVIFGTDQITSGMQMGEFFEKNEEFHPERIADYKGHISTTDSKRQDFTYVYKMKKLMQRFCTPVIDLDKNDKAAVLAKEFHRQKRMKKGKGSKNHKSNENGNGKGQDEEKEDRMTSEETVEKMLEKQKNDKGDKERVLVRKRFHNFTRTVMAHEFLSFRRVDRFFHRATLRFDDSDSKDENSDSITKRSRPYVVLSLKGDLFLSGQVRGMVGLLIAIVRGFIDEDILDCVFDEDYPNLVPCPFAPVTGLFAGAVNYANWEGRMDAVLTPRNNGRWKKGWKSQEIISTIEDFQQEMYKSIARAWDKDGNASLDQDLPSISDWIKNCLEPWSVRAEEQYSDYCLWKKAKEEIRNDENTEIALMEKLTPPLSSVSSDIPTLYRKVLELLQDADRCNLWPSTSPKRQLVMVSTSENDNENATLALQHLKAKSNVYESSSAYSFKEGQGGASGSFSVGAMPGLCEPPKGNSLFPELMKAAFELEIAICPDREPSSTIAINRNAQFRPHIDSGAGAGQSRSLIVGIGTYSGGDLMVEGEKHDIRYKPLEFNGWTERHWTRPFLGERYSLVWFTPIGCEGVYGIDLCK